MTIDNALHIKLLTAPDFSDYQGDDIFVFRKKIFQRHGQVIGNGGYGTVSCFAADDGTKVAVKSELSWCSQYVSGEDFRKEANWYQTIYGLGVFSGNANDTISPHYILMPYFEGKTLLSYFYPSIKDVIFCWIKTADAVHQLHQRYHCIHCDLKSDNVIMGSRCDQKLWDDKHDQSFVVDFGLATSTNKTRNTYTCDSQLYRQYAPETFSITKQKILAHPSQDIYSLGVLLLDLFQLFFECNAAAEKPKDTTDTIKHVKNNLLKQNPKERWSIAKAIFILISVFFSQIPRTVWSATTNYGVLNILQDTNLMRGLWRYTSTTAIQIRHDQLEEEQKALELQGKNSKRKAQKMRGLKVLESEIRIHNPAALGIIIAETKLKFPELTAGVFSKRTKILLSELATVALVFH